ncbi:hypothetical protein Tco_0912780 [Tanacetum coccineum]
MWILLKGGQVVIVWIQCLTTSEFGSLCKNAESQKGLRTPCYHEEKMLLCNKSEKGTDNANISRKMVKIGQNGHSERSLHSTIVTTTAVLQQRDSPAVPNKTIVETVTNMTPENRVILNQRKKAIHLILTGYGDEI